MLNHKQVAIDEVGQKKVAFYLCNTFNALSFLSALDPLRIANNRSGSSLFSWNIVTDTGESAVSSTGTKHEAHFSISSAPSFDMVFVSGPFDPEAFDHPPALTWLMQNAREGALIAGLETGSYLLAKAGLLNKVRCTTHWDNIDHFKQKYPHLEVTKDVYEVDDNRATCSGGAAPLDLAIYLIERDFGHELAAEISDYLIHPNVRALGEPQRMNLKARLGVNDPVLLECIELMEA